MSPLVEMVVFLGRSLRGQVHTPALSTKLKIRNNSIMSVACLELGHSFKGKNRGGTKNNSTRRVEKYRSRSCILVCNCGLLSRSGDFRSTCRSPRRHQRFCGHPRPQVITSAKALPRLLNRTRAGGLAFESGQHDEPMLLDWASPCSAHCKPVSYEPGVAANQGSTLHITHQRLRWQTTVLLLGEDF